MAMILSKRISASLRAAWSYWMRIMSPLLKRPDGTSSVPRAARRRIFPGGGRSTYPLVSVHFILLPRIFSICGMSAPPTTCPSMRKRGVPVDADPGADLFVGLNECGDRGILAGLEFHVVQFPGHRLFIGQGPVSGAEDITDLGLGVRVNRKRKEEDMPGHVISRRKKGRGLPAIGAVRVRDFDHRVRTAADFQGLVRGGSL